MCVYKNQSNIHTHIKAVSVRVQTLTYKNPTEEKKTNPSTRSADAGVQERELYPPPPRKL